MGLLGKPSLIKAFARRQTTPVLESLKTMKSLAGDIQEVTDLLPKWELKFGRTFIPCDSTVRPNSDHAKELCDRVRRIERILERPNAYECLSGKTEQQLLSKLSRHLGRKCTEIPKKYIFCDQRVTLTVVEREVYLAIYHILETTIKFGDIKKLQEWATRRTVAEIIQCWDSPDDGEQASVEFALGALCARLPEQKKIIYDIIMEKLQDADEQRYTLITAALKWLVNVHTEDVSIAPDIEVFKRSILPLFRSPYLSMFAKHLDSLAKIFYGYFEELPFIVVEYMLRHWPLTNSHKSACFVTHLGIIAGALGAEGIRQVADRVFERIDVCVMSQNFHVSLAALGLLIDRSFVSHFAEVGSRVFPKTCRAIRCHTHDGHQDVESSASLAINALTAACPECESSTEPEEDGGLAVRQKWMDVFRAVAEDHPEFEQEAFEKSLNAKIC